MKQIGDLCHVRHLHAAVCHDGRAQANAAGDALALAVVGQSVHVDDDAARLQTALRHDARETSSELRDIEENHVVVRPAGEHFEASVDQTAGEGAGVFSDGKLAGLVGCGQRLQEEHGLGRDVV